MQLECACEDAINYLNLLKEDWRTRQDSNL